MKSIDREGNKINIAFLLPVPPDHNGLANNVKRFATIAKNPKFKNFIFTPTKAPEKVPGFQIFRIKSGLLFPYTIAKLILMQKIKVIDIEYNYGVYGFSNNNSIRYLSSFVNVFVLLIMCRILKIKSVLTMHSVMSDIRKESTINTIKFPRIINVTFLIFNRILVALADHIVVLTSGQYDIIAKFTSKNKLHLIHHGMDNNSFAKVDHSFFTFLYVGLIRPNKGVNYLLDAFELLNKKYNNIRLIIAGSKDSNNFAEYEKYYTDISKKLETMKLNCNIDFFEGWYDFERISELISVSDAIVLPYIDHANETSGIANEFACSGLPLILSKIPRFESYFSDGENCLLFEPGSPEDLCSAMENIMLDFKLRSRIRENLLKMTKLYSWENITNEYMELYDI
ncbi:MAG: glycosyltransferase family 4 protein [Candidatus Parvarchaeota archaeon]